MRISDYIADLVRLVAKEGDFEIEAPEKLRKAAVGSLVIPRKKTQEELDMQEWNRLHNNPLNERIHKNQIDWKEYD